MFNKILKNLIILCAIVFTFAIAGASQAQACFGYNCEYSDVANYNNANSYPYYYQNQNQNQNQNSNQNQAYSQYNGYYQQPTTGYYNSYPQQLVQPQPIIIYTNPTTTTTATPVAQTQKPVVNNYYYYQTDPNASKVVTTTVNNPIPVPKTATNTTNTTTTNYTNIPDTTANPYNYNNNLGAAAYTGYNPNYTSGTGNGIAALTFRGTGGFLPSSIWQWMLVVILILAIVVIARTFVKKPSPADHAEHTIHVH